MTTNFQPGKGGSVTVSSTPQAWKKWVCKMFAKLGETPNFISGCMTRVAGIPDCAITLSGAHDVGNMPWTVNNAYTPTLGITSAVALSAPTLCESITETVDATEPVAAEISLLGNGTFTASIT